MAFWGRGSLAVVALALASAFAGCNGTDSGGTGDKHVKPMPNELGTGLKVHDVVGPATWIQTGNMSSTGCAIPQPKSKQLTGQVVVAVDNYDETGAGATGTVYIEDLYLDGTEPPPYSGLEVFSPSYTPPDLRVFTGDVVDSFGQLEEFLGPSASPFPECRTLPEFAADVSLRFESYAPPVPLTIVKPGMQTDYTRFDPIRGYANARQWLGMLVTMNDVYLDVPTCSNTQASCTDCAHCPLGRWSSTINIGGGITQNDLFTVSNELFDMNGKGPQIPAAATHFKSITGIVTYFYGFHIAPRSLDDIQM